MRKYQRIWEAIKANNYASIAAEPKFHPRIIKAVTKEKNADVGWKLMLSEKGKRYKLSPTVDGKVITFTLQDDSPITTDML